MGRRRGTPQPWGAPLPSARLHSATRARTEQDETLAQSKVFRRLPSSLRPRICAYLSKADLPEFRRYELGELYPEAANVRNVSSAELVRAAAETLEADRAEASAEAAAAAAEEAVAADEARSAAWWGRRPAAERRELRRARVERGGD